MSSGSFERMTMTDGAEVDVYRVAPKGERRGGLVLIQEIFGVNSHIRAVAEDYAAEGYEVLAPALFDREHPGFDVGYDPAGRDAGIRLARELHPFDLTMADTAACVAALAAKGPVFVAGYCYGGSVAWRAAQTIPGVAAASSYYGSLVPTLFAEPAPNCPVACHFGRNDHGIPIEGVEALIARGYPQVGVYVYEAGHGFNCSERADYDPESAALAKARTLALFRANGG